MSRLLVASTVGVRRLWGRGHRRVRCSRSLEVMGLDRFLPARPALYLSLWTSTMLPEAMLPCGGVPSPNPLSQLRLMSCDPV